MSVWDEIGREIELLVSTRGGPLAIDRPRVAIEVFERPPMGPLPASMAVKIRVAGGDGLIAEIVRDAPPVTGRAVDPWCEDWRRALLEALWQIRAAAEGRSALPLAPGVELPPRRTA